MIQTLVKLLMVAAFGLIAQAAPAAIVSQGELKVETKMSYVKLAVQAMCKGPRFEDDGYLVYYSPESYKEVSQYPAYSSKLLNRTCGRYGSTTELSPDRFEDVEILLYNYGAARGAFDEQVRQLIEAQ